MTKLHDLNKLCMRMKWFLVLLLLLWMREGHLILV